MMKQPRTPEHEKLEQQALDVEISFLEGLARRDPNFVEALQLLGDAYTRRGRFEDGLRIDRQLAELCPNDALAFYNLACSHSLLHQTDEALPILRKALLLGYNDWRWLAEDPDLDNLRKDPRYATLMAQLWKTT